MAACSARDFLASVSFWTKFLFFPQFLDDPVIQNKNIFLFLFVRIIYLIQILIRKKKKEIETDKYREFREKKVCILGDKDE